MPSADSGRLFGAVTNASIAEQLSHQGINIERRRIEVPNRTIKVVGNYVVKVRLYNEQTASLKVQVRSLEKVAEAAEESEMQPGADVAAGAPEADSEVASGAVSSSPTESEGQL